MSIKDLPHVTVEQVLALRAAAIELESKNYYLESKLAEERQGRDDAESLYIESLKKELATLKASLPKIKADAVKEIAKTNKCELNIPSYPESVVVCYFDDLMDDANKLEAGE